MSRTCGGSGLKLTLKISLFLILLTLTSEVQAQLFRGFVSGTVSDAQQAVIAGVQVTITNVDTNISRTIPTNEVGFYRFVALEPGKYSVAFKIDGFESQKFENIKVESSQEPVVNVKLRATAGSTEVNVPAPAGVELDKTKAAIQRILQEDVLAEIPLSTNRDITKFAY